ncbi:MAG: nucleoside deaminase, partial [Pyramidobacter sp.]|nr:nucleoside deaminase [Pyramidobacter sp.]
RRVEHDPTAHAEVVALRDAAQNLGAWNLSGCSLYVTLEPCPMCAGALVQARVSRLVYGCTDPKAGACGTLYDLTRDTRLFHRLQVVSGVMERECRALLQDFFQVRREKKRTFGWLPDGRNN